MGSLLGDKEDVGRKIHHSTIALITKIRTMWLSKDVIKQNIRLKLYKTIVNSVLTSECEHGLNSKRGRKAWCFKELRKILGIRLPVKITNKSLYEKCNETPFTLKILESRWRLLRRVLRRDRKILANSQLTLHISWREISQTTTYKSASHTH